MTIFNKYRKRKSDGVRPAIRSRRERGLSLVEVLISLSIVALLLVATGTAFNAAFTSYKENHDMATVSVSARNALHQMTSTIRSAWNTDPTVDPDDAIYVTDTTCELRNASGDIINYRYNAGEEKLEVSNDGEANWYTMVENVYPVSTDPNDQAIFVETPGLDGNVGRVEIRFMVSQDGLSRTVSAAAVPRNVLFGL
jgi:prepilin-type N-terminal cleavage/methylation domain-containing protein